jgi:hypothetical protein
MAIPRQLVVCPICGDAPRAGRGLGIQARRFQRLGGPLPRPHMAPISGGRTPAGQRDKFRRSIGSSLRNDHFYLDDIGPWPKDSADSRSFRRSGVPPKAMETLGSIGFGILSDRMLRASRAMTMKGSPGCDSSQPESALAALTRPAPPGKSPPTATPARDNRSRAARSAATPDPACATRRPRPTAAAPGRFPR